MGTCIQSAATRFPLPRLRTRDAGKAPAAGLEFLNSGSLAEYAVNLPDCVAGFSFATGEQSPMCSRVAMRRTKVRSAPVRA